MRGKSTRLFLIAGLVTVGSTAVGLVGCGKKAETPTPGTQTGQPAQPAAKPTEPPRISTEVALAVPVRVVEASVLAAAGLKQPRSIRIDPNGNVFLVDYVGKQMLVLSAAGSVTTRWPFEKTDILGMDMGSDGLLYALDTATMKVTSYKADGKSVKTVDISKNPAYQPRGFAVAADGTFWVADTGNSRVHHISAEGSLIKTIGGTDPFKFNQPSDIVVGADGTIAVGDGENKRVVILSAAGEFVRNVGVPGTGGADGIRLEKTDDGFLAGSFDTVWLIAKDGAVKAVAGKAAGKDEFQGLVTGVGWSAKEKVFYVSDAGARILKVFKLS